jgi:uncharacterized membrane protein (UPF0127 family)
MRSSASSRASRFGGLVLLGWLSAGCADETSATLPLTIGKQVFQVEVATTPGERERGLMGRTQLPANSGMLFKFEQAAPHCFWMHNTPLPLSIAFIDEQGRITNLADMQPQTDSLHCARTNVRYALEVAQGGFARRGITSGARVKGLP